MKIFTTDYPYYKETKAQDDNNSQYYGVYFDNRNRAWCSYVSINATNIYLGYYKDERVAAVVLALFEAQYHRQHAKFDPKIGAPNYRNEELYVGDIGPIPDVIIAFVDAKINGVDVIWTPRLEQIFCAHAAFPEALTCTTFQNQPNTNQHEFEFLYQQQINNPPATDNFDEPGLFPDLVTDSDTNISPNTTEELEFNADISAMSDQLASNSTNTNVEYNTGTTAHSTTTPTLQTAEFIGDINTEFGVIHDVLTSEFAATPIQAVLKITLLTHEYSVASLYVNNHHFILGIHEESATEDSAFAAFQNRSQCILRDLFNPQNVCSQTLEKHLASEVFSIILQRLEHPEVSIDEKNRLAQYLIDIYKYEKQMYTCPKMKHMH